MTTDLIIPPSMQSLREAQLRHASFFVRSGLAVPLGVEKSECILLRSGIAICASTVLGNWSEHVKQEGGSEPLLEY